jgi:hypothetical protein
MYIYKYLFIYLSNIRMAMFRTFEPTSARGPHKGDGLSMDDFNAWVYSTHTYIHTCIYIPNIRMAMFSTFEPTSARGPHKGDGLSRLDTQSVVVAHPQAGAGRVGKLLHVHLKSNLSSRFKNVRISKFQCQSNSQEAFHPCSDFGKSRICQC